MTAATFGIIASTAALGLAIGRFPALEYPKGQACMAAEGRGASAARGDFACLLPLGMSSSRHEADFGLLFKGVILVSLMGLVFW